MRINQICEFLPFKPKLQNSVNKFVGNNPLTGRQAEMTAS
ncbi:hypothetical protein EAKF1_ch1546c [Escherichia albertii KF1]|nr:hypothetical protein EAKF1_ch1546c [Escherichia albertii KF1]